VVNKGLHLYWEEIPKFRLDVTEEGISNNPFVIEYKKIVNGIAGLDLDFLYRDNGFNTSLTKLQNILKEAREKERVNPNLHHLFFCSVYDSNPRIIAQKGLFQIPRNLYIKENGDTFNEDLTEKGCEIIYTIEDDQREILLKKLEQINITTPRLFPDLQNICEYIKRRNP
jgi:hypothetical protein